MAPRALFAKRRDLTPPPKWDPRRKPYFAALTRAYDDLQHGAYYECLLRCAALEEKHGPTPWTQMLAMLIKKDRIGDREGALADARTIARNYPAWVDAQYNLGAFLQELGLWEDARWHLRKALQLDEDHVPSMVQLGICYAALGDHQAADRIWNQALSYEPSSVRDEYHLSPIFAARGHMREFMRLQELRWEAQEHYVTDHGLPPHYADKVPVWQGEPLTGKQLLVLDEQGAGDTIQFVRYLPQLCEEADTVWLRLKQPALAPLIRAVAPRVQLVPRAPLPFADYSVGLMSLFHRCVLVRGSAPPFPQHFIRPPLTRLTPRPVIGICWAGATSHPRDAQRSMTWETILPLVDGLADRCDLVDFTIGRERPKDPRVAPVWVNDYGDTIDALAGCDALVTVDTSVAHVAGAMGLPTHVLVTTLPDMRWGLSDSRTPWYDSWTIHRQTKPNVWTDPLSSVIRALQEVVS